MYFLSTTAVINQWSKYGGLLFDVYFASFFLSFSCGTFAMLTLYLVVFNIQTVKKQTNRCINASCLLLTGFFIPFITGKNELPCDP